MKEMSLWHFSGLLPACLLLVSLFAIVWASPIQPPVDVTTYHFGTIGQPRRVDPARAYDTASGELIMNVYEPLIGFSDKRVLPSTSANVSEWGYSDLSMFEPVLAESLPTISTDRLNWTITVKSGVKWHPWTAANGTVYNQFLTVEDVEYSSKRMLVQDMVGSPSWMICLPLCGTMYFGGYGYTFPTDEALVADIINNAITLGPEPNQVTFHMQPNMPWPQTAFMQILAQTWGCICNMDFCIEHGCWDGSFAAGWAANYRQKPSNSYTPLDSYYAAKSKYASSSSVPAMCGTGPYTLSYWDKANLEWRLDYWPDYRGGWNLPGSASHSLRTAIVKGDPVWITRRMDFLSGKYDSISVPLTYMWDLLQPSQQYAPLPGITLYYDVPSLSNNAMTFCFHVAEESPWISKVGGVPDPYFFANVNVRRAFAYAFNFTRYSAEIWQNEALQPASWWVKGLCPDYENKSLVPHNINLTIVEQELKAAGMWDSGFETYIVYYYTYENNKRTGEILRDAIQSLNALRPGKPEFKVNVSPYMIWLDDWEMDWMPISFVGWLADYAEPDNFVRTYMHSQGDIVIYQHSGNGTIDDWIDAALKMPDGEERNQTYQWLQYVYWSDVQSLPLAQFLTRHWQRHWVRGWYYNQLYPGLYFYDLYKVTAEPLKPVDIRISMMNVTQWLIDHHGKPDVEIGYPYGTCQVPVINLTVNIERTDNNSDPSSVHVVYAVYCIDNSGHLNEIGIRTTDLEPVESVEDGFILDNASLQLGNYALKGLAYVLSSEAYDENFINNELGIPGFEVVWLLGDVNCDRIVELMDFLTLSNAFGTSSGHSRWDIRCDVWGPDGPATSPTYAGDGDVEMMDFFTLSSHYGNSLDT